MLRNGSVSRCSLYRKKQHLNRKDPSPFFVNSLNSYFFHLCLFVEEYTCRSCTPFSLIFTSSSDAFSSVYSKPRAPRFGWRDEMKKIQKSDPNWNSTLHDSLLPLSDTGDCKKIRRGIGEGVSRLLPYPITFCLNESTPPPAHASS